MSEGQTLATLHRAPAIVHVFDFLEANGTAYIVMELATGETLGARLQRQKRLSAAEVERILRALLGGLEKVHAASFIHRDIKPDNILLDDEGQPTLIDFGAARAAPKSIRVGRPSPSSRMLSGLMSRWMKLAAWIFSSPSSNGRRMR